MKESKKQKYFKNISKKNLKNESASEKYVRKSENSKFLKFRLCICEDTKVG